MPFLFPYQNFSIHRRIWEAGGIFKFYTNMGKNKKNEELKSRREFFKKAAKGALPVLSFTMFGSTFLTSCGSDDCNNGCVGSCDGSCAGSCKTSCSGSEKKPAVASGSLNTGMLTY